MTASSLAEMYTPVHDSILQSSILLEDLPTRWLWTVMLILADQTRDTRGVVDCPVDRLAQLANLTVEQTRHAIERLSSPDASSRSKEEEGRRIVACENVEGFEIRKWRLVNWEKYKDEIRKAQMAAASRKYRQGKKLSDGKSSSHQASSSVIKPSSSNSISNSTPSPTATKKEKGERERQPKSLEDVLAYWKAKNLQGDPKMFYEHHEAGGWRQSGKPLEDWTAAARYWSLNEKNMIHRDEKAKKPANVHSTPGRYSDIESEEIKP